MIPALSRLPMFGLLGLAFVLVCTILAIACWLVFRSGEAGKTRLSGCAGCAIGLALLGIAGLAAIALGTDVVVSIPDELVRRGPVKSITLEWESKGAREQAHLRLELRGGADPSEITRWVRDHTRGDLTITVQSERGAGGIVRHVDIALPIAPEDLRELRQELERDLPRLEQLKGVRIELKDESD